VRVPDDVRPVVEKWVHAEQHCSVALEVRIVPTDGGLYVIARDDRGQSHERVVPDATSAGVLIASWVSDDALKPPAPRRPLIASIGAYADSPLLESDKDAPVPVRIASASTTADVVRERAPDAQPASTSPPPSRWIAISGFAELGTIGGDDDNNGHGLRTAIDLISVGPWTIDATASLATGTHLTTATSLTVIDAAMIGHVSASVGRGLWRLVPSLGAGWVYTHAHGGDPRFADTDEVTAIAETALAIELRIDRGLALVAGPLVTLYTRRMAADQLDRGVDVALSGGIRWGL
jgi:hypothetical protein